MAIEQEAKIMQGRTYYRSATETALDVEPLGGPYSNVVDHPGPLPRIEYARSEPGRSPDGKGWHCIHAGCSPDGNRWWLHQRIVQS
jgi:hypothetical protein